MASRQVINADLIVVGAGYAGVNAVYAATKHLPKNARIAWIETRKTLGGQWADQYDYVTLHQPYETFTVAGHSWNKKWHWSHLATKVEILEYFEEAMQACAKSSGVEIMRLFGYNMSSYTTSKGNQMVEAIATPVEEESKEILVRAKNMIKATGFQVPIKRSVVFSAANAVYSTCPADLLKESTVEAIQGSDKPVYVLGSGKTAIDTMNMLVKKLGVGSRLHCISGHGTLFINRDRVFPPKFLERNMYGSNTFLDWFRLIAKRFDGTNTQEILKEYTKKGLFHSPIEGSTNFVCG